MNQVIKELFNFNGDETQLQHLKQIFTNYLRANLKNGPKYFINLLKYYSEWRPRQQHVSKELVQCVFDSFPPEIHDEIQQYCKRYTLILGIIIFPEDFPKGGNEEQDEMFLLLENDDVDGLISFLS